MENKENTFEENLNNLDRIIKELEAGNVTLDDAINKYSEAMKLAKLCDEKLKNATLSVNKILTENKTLENFEVQESIFLPKITHITYNS